MRRWRRRRPELASPRPSPGSRTLPGLPSPRPQTPGSGCLFPLPVTRLLHCPGCGPDGAPPSPRPWSVYTSLLRCRLPTQDLVDLQDVWQDLSQGALPLFLHLQFLLLIQKWPLLPPPCAFEDFFRVPHPLLSKPQHLRHRPAWTLSILRWRSRRQGPTPEMIQGWKEEFMVDMKACWQQSVGDAPSQQTVGPAVPSANMGPDSLRQLRPSDDREASRAQHKAGSKRGGSSVRRRSRSSERSSTDRNRARVRGPQVSPDSSSPTRRLSPPAKRSRWDKRDVSRETSSSEGRQRSPRTRRPWRSRSPLPRRRGSSPSPSPHHRSRNSPAPSHCPSGANMTRRLAGRPSLSLRRRSPSPHRRSRRSSRGRQSSHPSRTRAPHRRPTLYRPPGHLNLKDIGPVVCLRVVTAPGPPARSVSLNRTHQTYISYDSTQTMTTSVPPTPIHVIPLNQNNHHLWMVLSCPLRKCRNSLQIS